MKRLHRLAAVALLALSPAAFAQSWYAGIGLGTVRSEVDAGRIDGELAGLGFTPTGTTSDTADSSWRIFAGYRVLPWLDVEAYYADLGKTKWDSTVTPQGTLSARIESKAYGIAAIASLSPVERLRLFAKVGVASTDADASFSSSGFVELAASSTSKRQTSAVYGIGMQYAVTPRVLLRVEYDVHDKVGSDEMGGRFKVQAATLGVVFPF
jgi:opacity protein-like surface antigen